MNDFDEKLQNFSIIVCCKTYKESLLRGLVMLDYSESYLRSHDGKIFSFRKPTVEAISHEIDEILKNVVVSEALIIFETNEVEGVKQSVFGECTEMLRAGLYSSWNYAECEHTFFKLTKDYIGAIPLKQHDTTVSGGGYYDVV